VKRLLPPLLLSLLALVSCGDSGDALDRIRASGELHFITRNSASTYYLGRDGPTGFEYELARGLAEELGVQLVVHEAFTIRALFDALLRREASIAGAGLTLTSSRSLRFPSSVSYATQRSQVIYKAGEARPREVPDLRGLRVSVLAHSSQLELLETLTVDDAARLNLDVVDSADPMQVLVRVRDDLADVAVVDSRDFLLQQNLVPRLDVAFDLSGQREVVWYLPPGSMGSALQLAVDRFLSERRASGFLDALEERFFTRDENISRVDSQTFLRQARQELRDYRGLIEKVADEHQLPWELLAAISYQESHWDPNAVSRTGVRGMMMLTRATARDLGVDDRTDPAQSLRGGARYFRSLRRRLPEDIREPDRSWMALAAYNIGMAHLEDARILTQRRGGDPHLWDDVMQALPLLEEAQHYRSLRHGYARGLEAVRYVQNIRHYYDILTWQSARAERPEPPADADDYLPRTLRALQLWSL
jgi:membrane-bound lytic murein transglycosylase F